MKQIDDLENKIKLKRFNSPEMEKIVENLCLSIVNKEKYELLNEKQKDAIKDIMGEQNLRLLKLH